MIFEPSVAITLDICLPTTGASRILQEWWDAALDPAQCRAILERVIEELSIDPAFFDASQVTSGGRPATDELLFGYFGRPQPWSWSVSSKGSPWGATAVIDADSARTVAAMLRDGFASRDVDLFMSTWEELFADPAVLRILTERVNPPATTSAWPQRQKNSIARREHASLLFTAEAGALITDPQCTQHGWTTNSSQYPLDSLHDVDAIAITHSHADHWHLPSILRYAFDEATPVIVPDTRRPSILTFQDFADALTTIGQSSVVLPWLETYAVKDLQLQSLPFWGEQPVATPPSLGSDLRNFGNCYRVDAAAYSAVLLADSGADPDGSVFEALSQSARETGPIDLLLSCTFPFSEGLNFGLVHNFLTLPFERLRHIYRDNKSGQGQSVTLGVKGVAQACVASGARFFAPYAQGFAGVGHIPPDEEAYLTELRTELGRINATTQIIDWRPGDVLCWEGREPRLVKCIR